VIRNVNEHEAQVQLASSGDTPGWSFSTRGNARRIRCESNSQLHSVADAMALLEGGNAWYGYFSYDLGRLFEEVPESARDELRMPHFEFASFCDAGPAVPPRVQARADFPSAAQLRSTFSRDSYLRAVDRVLDYIHAGDVFQVNLAQRFTVPLRQDPWQIYQRLIDRSPARYGAYLDFGNYQILCNSPELFLSVTPDRRVITRPIKGTRPRLPGMDIELRDSAKDQAELAMIVDLSRNDLGRVCEIGSVRVVEPREIEEHPTVYHGVATVEGKLRDDVRLVDLLRATFPPGSVTGAPKVRAMQIIEDSEPVRRGPYCGAIGYVVPDGSMEFAVAIRTMIVKDGMVHVPVGGGIVADSDPQAEYEETLVKAKAMFDALGVAV
jgi:aminodeoxychorismate synthase component I